MLKTGSVSGSLAHQRWLIIYIAAHRTANRVCSFTIDPSVLAIIAMAARNKDEARACCTGAVLPSIYSLYSPGRRNAIMISAALGFLLQYCTSIYLPAMKVR